MGKRRRGEKYVGSDDLIAYSTGRETEGRVRQQPGLQPVLRRHENWQSSLVRQRRLHRVGSQQREDHFTAEQLRRGSRI